MEWIAVDGQDHTQQQLQSLRNAQALRARDWRAEPRLDRRVVLGALASIADHLFSDQAEQWQAIFQAYSPWWLKRLLVSSWMQALPERWGTPTFPSTIA